MGWWRSHETVRLASILQTSCVLYLSNYRFWLNAIQTATESAQRRFVIAFQQYTDGVVQQSADRTHGRIRDVQTYFEVRRDTIGARPSFAINAIHDNLPDNVIEHPVIEGLTVYCTDMLIIGNDLCSYNIEYVCVFRSFPTFGRDD